MVGDYNIQLAQSSTYSIKGEFATKRADPRAVAAVPNTVSHIVGAVCALQNKLEY